MSDRKRGLPRFYKDHKAGKYTRQKPDEISKLTEKKETPPDSNKIIMQPKFSSILKYMRSKELGSLSGLNAEREYFKMTTSNMCLENEVSLNEFQMNDIVSVDYIKGTQKSVLGVWNISENSGFRCVVGERTFSGVPNNPNLNFKACQNYVIDLCEGFDGTVIYLYNDPVSGIGCFLLFPEFSLHFDTNSPPWQSINNAPFFCCSSATRGLSFAFGSCGHIGFYTGTHCERNYLVNGRVYTISFDDSSNVMVSGIHDGHLYVHDIRLKKFQSKLKVSGHGINDSCFIDPQHVIVAGPGNVLCEVDLRMIKVVTEYYGHETSVKKRPFSFANNMVCASGADNVIRIWHLSGGNPIHELKPVNNPRNETRGWIFSDANKTYMFQFEEHFKRTYLIA